MPCPRPPARRARLVAAVLVFACAAVFVAGCGGSGAGKDRVGDVVSSLRGLNPAKREAALVRRARAEGGTLRLYTAIESGVAADLASAFRRATGVRVSVYRANNEPLLTRVQKEAQARFSGGADVVETNGEGLLQLGRTGIFARYASPARSRLVPGADHGTWTTDRFQFFVIAWNTDRVQGSAAPRSYAELAAPRFRGRVAMEAGDADWYMALRGWWMRHEHLSGAAADARFEAIARNSRGVTGHTLINQLLGAGEFDAAASDLSYLVADAHAHGAPVAWRPAIAPVVSRANGAAILDDSPHPASAMLFVDWLLGPGQEVLMQHHVDPARRDLARSPGVPQVTVDIPSYVDHQHEWMNRYAKIVRLAGRAPTGG